MSPDRYTEAFRRAIEAPSGSRDRNLAAIERRIAAGEVVDEEEDDDAPRERVAAVPRGRWASALFAFKAVSLSVGLGVAGLGAVKVGAMTWSAIAKDERPPAAAPAIDPPKSERGAARRSSPRGEPAATTVPPSPAPPVAGPAPTSPSEAAPRDATLPRSRPRAKTPPSDLLREEVDLMTRARTELDAGRHEAVLALVAEHERRFPTGAMIEERRAWRAIATCSLRRANAGTEVQSFLDRHPRSSLAEKVRRACADRPTDPATRSD